MGIPLGIPMGRPMGIPMEIPMDKSVSQLDILKRKTQDLICSQMLEPKSNMSEIWDLTRVAAWALHLTI